MTAAAVLPDAGPANRSAALDWLWERAMSAAGAMRRSSDGQAYEPCTDDTLLFFAPHAEASAWLRDLEASAGYDVRATRSAMDAYFLARDGAPAPELDLSLRSPLADARARLHRFHPVLRGLEAMLDAARAAG